MKYIEVVSGGDWWVKRCRWEERVQEEVEVHEEVRIERGRWIEVKVGEKRKLG